MFLQTIIFQRTTFTDRSVFVWRGVGHSFMLATCLFKRHGVARARQSRPCDMVLYTRDKTSSHDMVLHAHDTAVQTTTAVCQKFVAGSFAPPLLA